MGFFLDFQSSNVKRVPRSPSTIGQPSFSHQATTLYRQQRELSHHNDNTMADPASSASLMNNYGEKAWSDDSVTEIHHHRQPKSKARRIWSAVMSARSILDTILLLVILVLLLDKGKQAATPKPEESTTMPVVQCIPAPAPVEASAPAETKPEEPKKPEFQLGGDITGFGPKGAFVDGRFWGPW